MYLSILVLPLFGSLTAGLLGRKLGTSGAHFITCICLLLSTILAVIAFYEVAVNGSPVSIYLTSWVDSEFMNIKWEFYFDQLSISLATVVLICSALIHIYSVDYLSTDPHQQRFMSYLSLFTFGMLVLVTGANYLVMFVGWELIGVVSYLLINFYFTRIQANKAAILALTMNRVGDFLLSTSFFAMFALFGSLDYSVIFGLVPYLNENYITLISLLLFCGAIAKSANIPLHSWLPGSMEAPTPVSALLHAATLVTAGIYLLVRTSPILEYSSTALLVVTIIGATTAFFGASCGLVGNDLKRIIAFSTISQLGYMVMAIGLSQYNVAMFHCLCHASFKAMLFLAAGAVIHAMQDNQDIRRFGGLVKFLPFIYSCFVVGSLSLMAAPFLSGFYSKDLILELAYGNYTFSGLYAYILGTTAAAMTAFYSFRLISMVFFSVPNSSKMSYLNVHESNIKVIIPLFVLALFSIFFGFLFADSMVGVGSDFFGNSVFIHPNNVSIIEAENLPVLIKNIPAIVTVLGAGLAIYLYNYNISLINKQFKNNLIKHIYNFFVFKYFFDVIYNYFIIGYGYKLGYNISKILDRGVVELIGPYGLTNNFYSTSKTIMRLDTGIISNYAIYIILSFAILIFLVFQVILFDTNFIYNSDIYENINNNNLTQIRFIFIYLFTLLFLNKDFN